MFRKQCSIQYVAIYEAINSMSRSAFNKAPHTRKLLNSVSLLPDQSASRHGKTCKRTKVFWQPADETFRWACPRRKNGNSTYSTWYEIHNDSTNNMINKSDISIFYTGWLHLPAKRWISQPHWQDKLWTFSFQLRQDTFTKTIRASKNKNNTWHTRDQI